MRLFFSKLKYLLILAIVVFTAGYATKSGYPLIFKSVLSFLASFALVFFANIIVAAIVSKSKSVNVNKDSVFWLIAHSPVHKFVVLIVIWTSQLSIAAHLLYGPSSSDGEFILILFGSIISYAIISLGKR